MGIIGACFASREECVVGHSMKNVRTGSAVFATAKRTGRKCRTGLITVFDAILMGRQSGQKLQCLYGNPIANNFFQN